MVAVVIGLVCLRTSGMAFIMITLAFAQMFYFLAVSLKQYGGDDGLTIAARSDFGLFSLASNAALYYFAFGAAASLCLFVFGRLVDCALRHGAARLPQQRAADGARSGFPDAALQARRLRDLGAGLRRRRRAARQPHQVRAPSYMAWQTSGELIVMIVLGGMGTLIGPVAGAAALLLLEEVLAGWTTALDDRARAR